MYTASSASAGSQSEKDNSMKRLIIILAALAAILPAAASANHLRGTYGEYGSNFFSFRVGPQTMRYSHHGNVPFVDEHGANVDYHSLRPNHPVTVDYSGTHGHETINRVIVHQDIRSRHHSHH